MVFTVHFFYWLENGEWKWWDIDKGSLPLSISHYFHSPFSLYRKNLQRWKISSLTYVICYTFCGIIFKHVILIHTIPSKQKKVYPFEQLIAKHKTLCHNLHLSSLECFFTRVHYLYLLTNKRAGISTLLFMCMRMSMQFFS